jgi:hypothetical protein
MGVPMMVSACSVRPNEASRPSILTRSALGASDLSRQHQLNKSEDDLRRQLASKVEGLGSGDGPDEMILLFNIARHTSNGIGIDGRFVDVSET